MSVCFFSFVLKTNEEIKHKKVGTHTCILWTVRVVMKTKPARNKFNDQICTQITIAIRAHTHTHSLLGGINIVYTRIVSCRIISNRFRFCHINHLFLLLFFAAQYFLEIAKPKLNQMFDFFFGVRACVWIVCLDCYFNFFISNLMQYNTHTHQKHFGLQISIEIFSRRNY